MKVLWCTRTEMLGAYTINVISRMSKVYRGCKNLRKVFHMQLTFTLCIVQWNTILSKRCCALECTDWQKFWRTLLHNLFFTFNIAEYILGAKPLVHNLNPQSYLTLSINSCSSTYNHSASDLMSYLHLSKCTQYTFFIRSNEFLSKIFRQRFYFFERVI